MSGFPKQANRHQSASGRDNMATGISSTGGASMGGGAAGRSAAVGGRPLSVASSRGSATLTPPSVVAGGVFASRSSDAGSASAGSASAASNSGPSVPPGSQSGQPSSAPPVVPRAASDQGSGGGGRSSGGRSCDDEMLMALCEIAQTMAAPVPASPDAEVGSGQASAAGASGARKRGQDERPRGTKRAQAQVTFGPRRSERLVRPRRSPRLAEQREVNGAGERTRKRPGRWAKTSRPKQKRVRYDAVRSGSTEVFGGGNGGAEETDAKPAARGSKRKASTTATEAAQETSSRRLKKARGSGEVEGRESRPEAGGQGGVSNNTAWKL